MNDVVATVFAGLMPLCAAGSSPPESRPHGAEPPPQVSSVWADRPLTVHSRGRRIASQTLLWTAAGVSLTNVIGHAATSIPAMVGHYRDEPSQYWRNRLLASQILGSTALSLTLATHVMGAAFHRSRSAGMRRAGRFLTVAAIAAHVVSAVVVPVLTPSDWEHGLIHVISGGLAGTGIAIAW